MESINGAAPTEYIDDDKVTTDAKVYSDSYARQKHLIEHFTSQYCTYCPLGYDVLNALTSLRSDIAWVSIHGIGSYKDVYTVSNASYITNFTISGYPSASFNRTLIDGESTLGTSLGYSSQYTKAAANMFSELLDEQSVAIPTFATIDINSTYDATTKGLDIKVTGEGVSDFKALVGDDAVLTVYLTEDSLVAKQYNQGRWVQQYEHNNVLRAIVSAPLGDAITWNGNSYEASYNTTIADTWNADNMHIVAFISRPIVYSSSKGFTTSIDDAWVTNTEKVRVGGASGISGVVNDAKEAKVIARYTVDGRKIDAPVKGLNIVKLANGKTMKVIVK